jgi:hypothetical protein
MHGKKLEILPLKTRISPRSFLIEQLSLSRRRSCIVSGDAIQSPSCIVSALEKPCSTKHESAAVCLTIRDRGHFEAMPIAAGARILGK